MYDDDNAYDNFGGEYGGSDTPSADMNGIGTNVGFNTLGTSHSTAWLDPQPFGAQNGGQTSPMNGLSQDAHDWLKRDTDPPVVMRTLEMRGPDTLDGSTRYLTMGDIAHLPGSMQHMMIKTSAPASNNAGADGGDAKLSTDTSADGAQNSGREEFQHRGLTYSKENGRTYMHHPELPGGVLELTPESAADLDRQRAEERERQATQRDATWTYEGYSPNPDGPHPYQPDDVLSLRPMTPAEKNTVVSMGGALGGTVATYSAIMNAKNSKKAVGAGLIAGITGDDFVRSKLKDYFKENDPEIVPYFKPR